jgi:hypothetical protein
MAAAFDVETWQARRDAALQGLARCLFRRRAAAAGAQHPGGRYLRRRRTYDHLRAGAGLTLAARQRRPAAPATRLAIVLDLDGAEKAEESELATTLEHRGLERHHAGPAGDGQAGLSARQDRPRGRPQYGRMVAVDRPSAAGPVGHRRPPLARRPDGTRRATAGRDPACRHGASGPGGHRTTALEPRISRVAASDTLASYVTDVPYEGQRLGTIVPGILRDAGDVAHLAALIAPRRLVIGRRRGR